MSEPAQKGTSPWFTFRAGAHSQERDSVELPFVFAKLALAPEYNGRQPLGVFPDVALAEIGRREERYSVPFRNLEPQAVFF